ncbi:MAG: hypothetical protein DRI69_02485 [Bacteroidetes bacterium]|nr:MAG: hypothetical protein DRI69_02485 [Bacteroidota bacterium]
MDRWSHYLEFHCHMCCIVSYVPKIPIEQRLTEFSGPNLCNIMSSIKEKQSFEAKPENSYLSVSNGNRMNSESHNRIHKRVKKKKDFLTHLGVYVAVALFFLAINIATFDEGREVWFFFPMIPWGVGLMIHYFSVFGLPGTRGMVEKWELEETALEMRKFRDNRNRALPSGEEADEELALPELKRRKDPLYNEDEFV